MGKGAKAGADTVPGLIKYVDMLVTASLAEDVGGGDITTEATIGARKRGRATLVAKEEMVVAGNFVAKRVFEYIDDSVKYKELIPDGERAKKGAVIATVSGRLAGILTAERVALNFLQRLSGIATLTAEFVSIVKGRVQILDTRKTTPCLRLLERYAVKVAGGTNHRFGLYDAVLIKDNHIAAAGGVPGALKRAKKVIKDSNTYIEIEARTLKEVKEAIACGVDAILLDNMDNKKLKSAVKLIGDKAAIEASGGITLANVASVSRTGVNRISVGALTHSARAVDITLRVAP